MKFLRLISAAVLCLVGARSRALAIDAAVIISEIQYHPAAGDTEWIELHSLSGVDIDMSGWRLADGVEFSFAEGTKIPGHGYLVVAANPGAPSLAGTGALGPWTGALANDGEKITLLNRDGREMESVRYSDGGEWPVGADGSGATLSRRNVESADPSAAGWTTSVETGGTPGRANFAVPGQPPTSTSLSELDSVWKYFVGAPPAGWQQATFDDSTWQSGPSLLYSGSPTLAGGSDGLLGYWPLDETSGTSAANLAPGGSPAVLVNNPPWLADPQRGRVLQFTGASQYVKAGDAIIPQMTLTNDFTWAFWASSAQPANFNIIVGNRYSPTPGVDWSPREFIKFTTTSFEFHRSATPDDLDYPDIPLNTWFHHAVVKQGNTMTYYRNGVASGTHAITQGLVHPQSLYFGGEQTDEYWAGKLDDVAIWTRALTAGQVAALNSGTATPLNVTTAGQLRTPLASASSYAFRRAFTFTGSPSRTTLALRVLMEDGITVWLNGQQVYTQNNPPSSGTANADISGEIAIPNGALLKGNNVLAVEVQTFADDPDMVFGATLTASEQPPVPVDSAPGLVFNEISAGGAGFQLELANSGSSAIDLTGYSIRSSSGSGYILSGTLNAGALLVLDTAQLGFAPLSGDELFLFKSGGTELLDARQVTGRLRGRSAQFPGRWLFPTIATFGAPNAFTLSTDIVVNEIMYKPRPLTDAPFAEDPEQWIELFNRSAAPVVLTGWRFAEGINFDFPDGTTIGPGGYLVISSNAVALKAKWPGVAATIIGDFAGAIRRGGERLQLADANGNPADEVTFTSDQPWPLSAAGEGSSLELRDPRADNSRPEAWAASDESARGSWQTYTYEGPATPSVGNDPTTWNEFIFGLLGPGSVMIDDISVIENPTGTNRQLIQNGTFDSDASKWRFLGTHRRAAVITDPFSTGQVLRVDASDATEHMHNHAETTLKFNGAEVTINGSATFTYRISFRARWVSGSNQLNTRLYFNRLARITLLPVAPGGGTPGAPNSARIPNLGPTFAGLSHSPAVPTAGQPAIVSVTASDPDGVAGAMLFYAVNPPLTPPTVFTSVAMNDEGGGRFTGTIPGQASGAKVQFYVQAADSPGAIGFAPPLGPQSRAIVPWNDGQARLTLNGVRPNNLRIVMTAADTAALHTVTNVMSNDRLPCTVIWNERDVYYDCGVHLHGSERGRDKAIRVSFNVRFPGDQLLLGVHSSVVLDRSGAGDEFSQKEILVKRAITHAGGLPGSEDDLARLIAPQIAQTGPAILARQRVVSTDYLDSAYANGGDGDLFKYELIYYPLSASGGNRENLKLPEPDDVRGVGLNSLGTNKEAYRWHWLISNREEADDYSGLITFLTAFGRPASAQYYADTAAMMDVSEWLRSFAVVTLFGVLDTYATGAQHNLYVYRRPADGRWIFLPYDMDFTFAAGATSPMIQNADLSKLTLASQNPGNLRTYWAHVYELCQTSFNSAYLRPWAAHYTAFVNQDLTQFMSYVDQRRTSALTQLNSAIPPAGAMFDITTPDGSSPGPTVTLNGKAWVDVAQMRLNGSSQPLAVTWLTTTSWQTSVPIAPGTNTITINAFDAQGAQIGTDTVTITGTGDVFPADATNLVISEIMYHPGVPTAEERGAGFADAEQFEFLELQNISASPITLANCSFTAGTTFNLPGTTLPAGARALLVGNQAAFTKRYGAGVPAFIILGQYQPGSFLANGSDHLRLLDAHGQAIRDFSYSDSPPWPSSPDGGGYSLVLINPTSNPDHANPANWRASVALGGNPGSGDATSFTGNALADDNGDGVVNLLQYALAGSTPYTPPDSFDNQGYLALQFRRNLAADDLIFTVERSLDLQTWDQGALQSVLVSEAHNGDGTATYTWRSSHRIGETPREFLRLRVTKR